jgi:hypothetical protein
MNKQDSIAWTAAAPSSGGATLDAKHRSDASMTLSASNGKSVIDRGERRSLELIANELTSVIKRQAADVIKIGGLLAEAKAQLSHGQWLAWLAEHFPLSKSTVANYINSYKFATQFPTVGNLKIHTSALYLLASSAFNATEISVILKVAETKWVDSETVFTMRHAVGSAPPREPKASDLGHGSKSPSSPKMTSSMRSDAHLREKFVAAMQELEKLRTHSSGTFVGVISMDRLRAVTGFLSEVEAVSRRAA